VNVYSYTVLISAPGEFAAQAIIGGLHEIVDEVNRLFPNNTPCEIIGISASHDLGEMPEDKPAIDTIPLF
jgi:hypothetical protein